MKFNEIIDLVDSDPSATEVPVLFKLITRLNAQLKWAAADENITLAAYNEYNKFIKENGRVHEGVDN
jgi:hypothetical protein